jgi:hypothetical protein
LEKIDLNKKTPGQTLMAHICNPSYSAGRNQKDQSSKPAWANSSMRPYLEKTLHKKGLKEWLKVWAFGQAPVQKKKKKKDIRLIFLK